MITLAGIGLGAGPVLASAGHENAVTQDEDRTAGAPTQDDGDSLSPADRVKDQAVDDDSADVPPPKPATAAADPEREEDSPGTLHQDFTQIEPIGMISEGSDGGLGEDVWVGSDRDKIARLMANAPAVTYYPAIQDLTRRLYLTRAKPDYFNHGSGRPEPGQDLLTLRLEKLEQMGLYGEATKMYSQIVDVPYHERLARAGVLSMMQGGKGSLGCLETRTVTDRFGDLEFWQTLNAVCDTALSRMSRHKQDKSSGLEGNDIDLGSSSSPVLRRLAKDGSFVYRVDTQQDIANLSPIERAALQVRDAFAFEHFRFSGAAPVSPAAFGVMLGSRNASESMRFIALVKSASHGLKPVADIQEQYDLFKNNTREKPVGWRQLTVVYRDANNATPGPAQNALLAQALSLSHSFGGPYAITPFANMFAGADPHAFTSPQVFDAIRVMIAGNITIPTPWLIRIAAEAGSAPSKNLLLLTLAAELNSDLSTETEIKQPALRTLFAQLGDREKALIAAAYEKLDKSNKLHNYADPGVYEKITLLTGHADYVMPVGEMTIGLASSFKDKKLGESVLLSAIALQGVQPGNLNPGLLQEVVGGMRLVGLTKEARALATQTILGLSK